MWFKNLRVYRFTKPFELTAEALAEKLEPGEFVPCGSQDTQRRGWVAPLGRHGVELVHAANGRLLLCEKRQEKVIPAAVVNERIEEKALAISEAEHRRVGRKERQNIKDEVLLEMLPKAFARSSVQHAFISPADNLLVVNASSAKRAEELLESLREAVGSLSLIPLGTKNLPLQAMTSWLTAGEPPAEFEFGSECELRDLSGNEGVIRCRNQDLYAEELQNHLVAGMQVSKLGLVWKDGIEFIVDDQLAIKRVKYSDAVQEKADRADGADAAQQLDMEFAVMTVEVIAMIEALQSAFGGLDTEGRDVDEIVARAMRADSDAQLAREVEEV
ncbi:recombination-associated protein RdgC [Biformimicrobium ophioploci]|uniref:Recombination-associated protein RdgC n=1 Tax=Biformimicrobium ophioploci TaxID=3036711 RepID=A0ABQ6LZ04_9GAMM|nr:recombination-associated protein RdgC [Microbulbifer sp. NKW57]GMG87328.1 recombination-associated protein RdgC [Microbulbifer sp. NKW57]